MREALSGLTIRGRAFLGAGVTALVCAIIIDQRSLLRVGVLLIALPLVTAMVVGRGRYRVSLVRVVEPDHVEIGQPTTVEVTIVNEGWIPTGTLMLEEQVPYTLGSRPRFVVDRIGHGWRRRVRYRLRSDLRGRFQIGPMRVTVADPFGLVELGRSFQTSSALTVTPRTVPLSPVNLSGSATASGDSRPRAFSGGSAEDVTVREYRRGDDLRRVHWHSSARVGELMVRREEQPWQARATVFIDNREIAHRGHGSASSFEAAVSTAASIATHLSQRGFSVRLTTSSGQISGAWHARELDAVTLLDTLAVLAATPATAIDDSWLGEAGQSGLTVAVLGAVDDSDLGVLRRVRHQAGAAFAFVLDVSAWDGPGSHAAGMIGATAPRRGRPEDSPRLTQLKGWKAIGLGPADSLDAAWISLATRGERGATRDGVQDGARDGARDGGTPPARPAEATR
ncbi:MAG: DUF58 domain-containing protein [Nocardioides sp.]|uniref:DUF58 domain-containing protein n=1 Tax=Nocardioides sp. TaxID=35761 RepID=UPI0039E4B86C